MEENNTACAAMLQHETRQNEERYKQKRKQHLDEAEYEEMDLLCLLK